MDLVIADSNFKDVELVEGYELDQAYGSDENNFQLELPLSNIKINTGYFFYADGTEYGGIIDEILTDTRQNVATYKGRTWQGILESLVIIPPSGAGYYVANGDANQVIRELLVHIGADNMFEVKENTVGNITEYRFRYDSAYSGITKMLAENRLKLKFECVSSENGSKILVSAEPIIDYSIDEEWDSEQVNLLVDEIGNQINHLICLGSGELANRNVIHLFTDQYGNIQPYKFVENPIKDSEYITDERNKVLFGKNEIAYVYDYPSIETIDNYELLLTQPSDWASQSLFYAKVDNSYEQLSPVTVLRYAQLSSQPSDWVTNYTDYYQVVNNAYASIAEQSQYNYTKQTAQPSDWETNWSDYYYYVSDGTSYSYEKVPNAQRDSYELQIVQPSDWNGNFEEYFYESSHYIYSNVPWDSKEVIVNAELMRSPDIERYYIPNDIFYLLDSSDNSPYNPWDIEIEDVVNTYEGQYYEIPAIESFYAYINGTYIRLSRTGDFDIDVDCTDEEWKAFQSVMQNKYNLVAYREYCRIEKKYKGFEAYFELSDRRIFFAKQNVESALYQKDTIPVVPAWKPNTYYTKKKINVAPEWKTNYYYTLTITHNPPPFKIGTYYRMYTVQQPNPFVAGTYYRLHQDHFSNLVAAGIKKLEELRRPNLITTTLDATQEYDIGDLIGTYAAYIDETIKNPITKKILRGSNGTASTSYELGGNN